MKRIEARIAEELGVTMPPPMSPEACPSCGAECPTTKPVSFTADAVMLRCDSCGPFSRPASGGGWSPRSMDEATP